MDLPENPAIILEAQLSVHPKSNAAFNVRLTKAHIALEPTIDNEHAAVRQNSWRRSNSTSAALSKPVTKVHLADVIGCDCAKGRSSSDLNAYLSVYSYPHVKKFGSKKTERKRQVTTLMFSKGKDFKENHTAALHWKSVLLNLIRDVEINSSQAMVHSVKPPPAVNFLVLVNPFSGPGKALHIFQERIVPLLAEAGILYRLIVTEYAGHATELTLTLNLDEWSGILIVSGDGLVYEVVNGLMSRPDWEKAIKTPIGALPGGSGNALCCSLLYQAKEPYLDNCALHATFLVAKHTVAPMDLVAVDLCSGRRIYSFLAIGWGMIADVDIESEKFRNLGNARFTLGAVLRIVGLRKYKGRLSFLPADGNFQLKRCHSYSGQDSKVSGPRGDSASSYQRSVSLFDKGPSSQNKVGKPIKGKEDEKTQKSRHKEQVVKEPISPRQQEATAGDSAGDAARSVETSLLVPLSEPVPGNWITVEDDFVLFVALYQTHIAQDMVGAPDSKLDDGLIHLIFMSGNVSRMKLIQLLNAIQAGEPPLDDPHVNIVRVHAFRLEPLTDNGNLTVDGEVVDYGPIQAQVLPSMARIMTLRPKDIENNSPSPVNL